MYITKFKLHICFFYSTLLWKCQKTGKDIFCCAINCSSYITKFSYFESKFFNGHYKVQNAYWFCSFSLSKFSMKISETIMKVVEIRSTIPGIVPSKWNRTKRRPLVFEYAQSYLFSKLCALNNECHCAYLDLFEL